MSGILKYLGKALFIVMYPVLLVVLLVLVVLLYQEVNNNQKTYEEYVSLHEEYDIPAEKEDDAQSGIRQLGQFFEALTFEFEKSQERIDELQEQINTESVEGYGEIVGSILPFVTATSGFNQYQRVCAELTSNRNLQYCVSVSALQKGYRLLLPEGEYEVFAKIQDAPEYGRAYYTKYIQCSRGPEGERCSESLSDENIVITIESGGIIDNVDPADWSQAEI